MPLETDGVVKEGSQTQFAREDISRRVRKFRHNKVSTVLFVWTAWNKWNDLVLVEILKINVLPIMLRKYLIDYYTFIKC